MRKHIAALVIAGTALAGVVVAPSAQAAETTATFTLDGGDLSISAPASAELSAGTATGSASLSGLLGSVIATDERGELLGQWTATAAATDFTTGTASGDETIADDGVTYSSGVVVPTGVVVAAGTVLPVNIADPVPAMDVGLAWRRNMELTPPMLAFRSYFQQAFHLPER